MSKKHSPGPWKYTWGWQSGISPTSRSAWQVFDAKENEFVLDIPDGVDAEGNARLIAAAPELFETLELLIDACLNKVPTAPIAKELFNAQQVLKKAGGNL